MTGLADVVRALAGRDGVESVVLFSADGLTIDAAGHAPLDADAAAALTATLAQHADRLGAEAGSGALRSAVVEFDAGAAIVTRVAEGSWLLVVTRADASIGTLLYDLRRHAPALAALL